jgi:hypothetical protein
MIRQLRRLFWFIVLLVVVLLWAKHARAGVPHNESSADLPTLPRSVCEVAL